MDTHGAVKVGFGRSHFECNTQSLAYFARIRAHHMCPQHAIRLGIDDQFHHGALFTAAHRVLQRPEGRLKNRHLVSGGHCFLFCQPHRANGRLAEHSGRDGMVIHGLGLTTKLGLRKGHRLANGHRCQFPSTGHITQREDAGFSGLKRIIDFDVASLGERHPGMLESQLCNIRSATGRVQYGIKGRVTVREVGDYATGLRL